VYVLINILLVTQRRISKGEQGSVSYRSQKDDTVDDGDDTENDLDLLVEGENCTFLTEASGASSSQSSQSTEDESDEKLPVTQASEAKPRIICRRIRGSPPEHEPLATYFQQRPLRKVSDTSAAFLAHYVHKVVTARNRRLMVCAASICSIGNLAWLGKTEATFV
jgi:hypothetical protein